MASLFLRIREMVSAHAHHQLDEAENPHVMAQQVLRDLSGDIQGAQRALVTALGAEKSLARQHQQLLAEAAEWEAKAEKLLVTGNEPLARGALEKALLARGNAEQQQKPLDTAQRSVARMREQVERLKGEWDRARGRAAQITANQAAATAMGVATRVGDHYTSAMDRSLRLDTLSRKAASFECEVEAASELLGERDQFERDVERADVAAGVDAALAALKQRLAGQAQTITAAPGK